MRERLVHRMAIVGRPAIGPGLGAGWTTTAEHLAIDEREPSAVHRQHELPLLACAALQHHTANRMTAGANLLRVAVGRVFEVDQPPLALEVCGLGFFRGETEVVR